MDQAVTIEGPVSAGRTERDTIGLAALRRAAAFCFAMMAVGQGLFVLFLAAFYYPRTLTGNFTAWNDKPLIQGYTAGDTVGNLAFAAHVLLAAVTTSAGLLQMVPAIRLRWPAVHRWSGRVYLTTAVMLAFGGLWLVWVRGSTTQLVNAVGISFDAALIVVCAALAWRYARDRRFQAHRRWALRTFVVASAVWFMRVGYGFWGMATGGIGIGENLDGPFDLFLAFAVFLLPLGILELYLRADARGSRPQRLLAAAVLVVSGLIVAMGSAGAWLGMWSPYI
jgi:hypothetical protein